GSACRSAFLATHPGPRDRVHRYRALVEAQRRSLRRGLCPGAEAIGWMLSTGPTGSLLADLAKQRDLPFGRTLPIEPLGISTGGSAGRRICEQVMDRGSESVGRGIPQDAPGLRSGD